MTTKVLTAHIPLPLAEKIDQLATRLERSRTWIIKQALSAWIDYEGMHYFSGLSFNSIPTSVVFHLRVIVRFFPAVIATPFAVRALPSREASMS